MDLGMIKSKNFTCQAATCSQCPVSLSWEWRIADTYRHVESTPELTLA